MHTVDRNSDNSFQDQQSAQHVIAQGDKCEPLLLIFSHFGRTEVRQIFQIDCSMHEIYKLQPSDEFFSLPQSFYDELSTTLFQSVSNKYLEEDKKKYNHKLEVTLHNVNRIIDEEMLDM
jgi:hypothetical protein